MNTHKNNQPITRSDIHEGDIRGHLEHIHREFEDGFEFLKKYPKSVTIFGSSMAAKSGTDYARAEELSGRIVRDLKYAVITGGGPGIMEAANKGAYDAGGVSIGFNVSIPHESGSNPFVTHSLKFSYFFSRKTLLTFAAEAYVYFPGGFGTFDELFSILTLIQTGKIPRVPVILFDSKFWNPVVGLIRDTLLKDFKTIDERDLKLFEVVDSIDHAIEVIRKAPVSEWWRNIN